MSASTTRRKVQRTCKSRGYTRKVDALDEILSFVGRFDAADEDEAIDLLLDQLEHESLKSTIIDKEPVHRVVSLLLEAEAAAEESSDTVGIGSVFRVVDAFLVPKFRYDPIKKQFYEHTSSLPIHGEASARAALYRDRFQLLFQKLSRDQHFAKPAFDSESSYLGSCEISPIQSLIGQTGRRWIMGVISQLEDGHFYLEDLTASVEINLSAAKITTGFFTENTIIVAEGEMLVGGVFQIRLADMEKRAVNDMFVILSDIWLDSEEAMGKLKTVLDGFESVEVVPSLFVFMGNFSSM